MQIQSLNRKSPTPKKPFVTAMTKLLVATSDYRTTIVEVINFDQSRPDVTCSNLPDLPVGLGGGTGIMFRGTTPIICGRESGYGEFPYICQCFKLEQGIWKTMIAPSLCLWYSESVAMNYNNNDFESYVLTGGYSSEQLVDNFAVFDGQTWTQTFPSQIPLNVGSHCTIKINSTLILMIGGYYLNVSKSTYFCDIAANICFPGPNLSTPRFQHACGTLSWLNPLTDVHENVIVAAGGLDSTINSLQSVELLYINKYFNDAQGWIFGPNLLHKVSYARIFDFEKTVIIGGGSGDIYGNEFFQLASPTANWVKMRQFLRAPRDGQVMFLIPDKVANC